MNLASKAWKTLLVAAICAALPARSAAAQDTGVIRGTVTDSTTHQPIAGAQVQIVGSDRGAVADASGVYRLSGITPGTVTIRVQRIGFGQRTREVNVTSGATSAEDFALQAIATTLSQVVVVGYGSRSRAEVTGALTTVAAGDIANTPIAGVDAMLQGKAAGVQVTQNAGNPGNGISVRIRGSSSLSASNQPLYVVDGVPIQQGDFSQLGYDGQNITAVTSINPDEIETITVLKDAASAAIYGSRASNGVILITTKRGSSGKPRISFNGYTGSQKAEKQLSLLTGKQYIEYMAEGAVNDGYDPADYNLAPGVDDQINSDWQSAIFRSAPVRDLNLGVSGGNDRTKYYVSGSYFGQDGVVIGSSYNRSSGRANLDFDVTDRLAFSTSIGLSRETNYRIQGDASLDGIVTNAIGNQPNLAIRNPDGSFTTPEDGLYYSNPVALAKYNYSPTYTQRTLANLEARYKVLGWLQFTGRAAGDQLVLHERQWQSPIVIGTYAASVNGIGKSGYSTGNRFLGEGFFTITPWAGSGSGAFSATVGAGTERNRDELNFVRGEGFSSAALHDAGNATTVTEYDASRGQNNLVSYFARANFGWADRYLATASLRADGSSKFGQNNRFGIFPAISLGWVISQEPFFGRLAGIGLLKLRGSYGVTGNQGIGNSAYLATYGSANYGTEAGTAPNNFANPNLKWENTKEADLGFDWNMLDGRIGIVGDYYNKKTSNLLISRPITGTSGFTSFTDNVGNIENNGIELDLTTENVRAASPGGLSWQSNFNISTNKNRVTALYQNQPLSGGVRSVNSVRVGEALGAFYLLQFNGVDPATGDAIFEDVNGDGSFTAEDRIVGGNPQPTHWGGFTNTFAYRNLDLRAALQFSGGNKIFNAMRLFADDGGYNYDNKLSDVLRRWQKPGDITDEPRASFDGLSGARQISTRWLENGSYTRLQEVTIGFRVPASLVRSSGLEGARIYVSGRNLHTFTGYKGYNPDVNSNGSSSNIGLGTDFYAYPLARTFMVGVSGEW
jgi:TonB-linked SusC/RagA family outer membrane protein